MEQQADQDDMAFEGDSAKTGGAGEIRKQSLDLPDEFKVAEEEGEGSTEAESAGEKGNVSI